MTLFYVYVNIIHGLTSSSRILLTCESRYVADELFRKLQVTKNRNGALWFPSLARSTPQFWYFDTTTYSPDMTGSFVPVLRSDAFLPEFRSKVMTKYLGDGNDRTLEWPIIPVTDGPDWVHNGIYCIRNKRRPNRYWTCDGGFVNVSDTKQDKFQIRGVGFTATEFKVLIRSDRVQISPVAAYGGKMLHIGMKDELLIASATPGGWTFGELLGGFKESGADSLRQVKWATDNDGDDWELC